VDYFKNICLFLGAYQYLQAASYQMRKPSRPAGADGTLVWVTLMIDLFTKSSGHYPDGHSIWVKQQCTASVLLYESALMSLTLRLAALAFCITRPIAA
jgi:hypothetical protein